MGKAYLTYNRVRLALFVRSYAGYTIVQHIKAKYKIDNKLAPKDLRKKYGGKRTISEISRLSRVLNLHYKSLWEFVVLDKTQASNRDIAEKDKIKVYLSIENELIALSKTKQNKSPYFDPDYETEVALLSVAIERAAGCTLKDIDDDRKFQRDCEELQRKYLYWYYKVAYRYKLPTTRIVPFILRLIN